MKKILSVVFAFLIAVSGCSNATKSTNDPEKSLSEYLNNIDSFESATRGFGEPASHLDMTEDIVIGFHYPQTEFDFVNADIKKWVDETVAFYIAETAEATNLQEPAELSVAYESDIISNSYAYIKLSGVYASSGLAHPVDIVKTYNIDINSNRYLTADDIFIEDGKEKFIGTVMKTAGIDEALKSDGILNNFILKKDGIEVSLLRGEFLPMSEGTKKLFFSYSGIKDLLRDSFTLKPHSKKKAVATLKTINKEEPVAEQVIKTPAPQSKPSNPDGKKMIALTFDDGPSSHTDRLLDIFKKHGGKATFFVVGNLIDRRPQTLIRMRDEGHQIASHSWDHRQLTKLDSQQITDQIMMTRAKVFDVTGVDPKVMRPPYGSCNNRVKEVGKELGVSFVNWSVDTLDWKTKNANSIYNEIMRNKNNGAIILCHDLYGTTVSAMEKVIPKLIEEGYELVTVEELIAASGGLEPGRLYFRQ